MSDDHEEKVKVITRHMNNITQELDDARGEFCCADCVLHSLNALAEYADDLKALLKGHQSIYAVD